MKKIILVLLLAGIVGTAGYLYAQSQIGAYRDQAFRSDSIAAASDTARALVLASLGDSTAVWQRRIVQTELERDSIDRELGLRPVVEIPGELRIDTIHIVDTVEAEPSESDSIQQYDFEGDDHPFAYIGHADIEVFKRRALFNVRVFPVEAIPISTRISCSTEAGVKSAHVTMLADDPFSVIPGQVRADPDVCNPPRFQAPVFSFTKGKAVWGGVGVLIGVGVAHLLDDGFRKARY